MRIGRLIPPAFAVALLFAPLSARQVPSVDPPPVDEEALARRLFEMTRPSPGERAIIVHDPTYYPGITNRLREALQSAGVQTFALQEDTPAMMERYMADDALAERREQEIVSMYRPLFRAADIFYWMPTRGYADDLRWERLVDESRVRSVHFHWMLRFPGTRSPEEIAEGARALEQRALRVDLEAHAATQRRLGDALRGQTLRITTPAGTDLTVRVPADQWFHFGDGDASKARAATARSIRDRQQELPVGMFMFVPDSSGVRGTLVAPAIGQSGGQVRNARFQFDAGRAVRNSADAGEDWIRTRIRHVGPDGDRVGTIFINTHPSGYHPGLTIDVGSNWENGGRNRAVGMRRMTMRLSDATVTAGATTIMHEGRLVLAARSQISSETPVWSPDSQQLAFSSGPAMHHQIYVINADGSRAQRLTEGEQNRWPSWSPDGKTIVFMSDRDGQGELYLMNPDGSGQRRLTRTPAHEFAPAWSPKGDSIVCLAEMPGAKQQLLRVWLDGRVERLDGDHLYYGRIAWLPDGSRFLVAANRDASTTAADRWKVPARLFSYSPDGRDVQPVTEPGTTGNPSPSRDGRRLVVDGGVGESWASDKGQWDLSILDLATGEKRCLTNGDDVNDWGPAWSPDGRYIAFASGRNRVYALTVIAADGSGRRTLTRTDRLPDH